MTSTRFSDPRDKPDPARNRNTMDDVHEIVVRQLKKENGIDNELPDVSGIEPIGDKNKPFPEWITICRHTFGDEFSAVSDFWRPTTPVRLVFPLRP